MAKAKDTAKEAPKARTSKAKEKAAEKALLEGAMAETPEPLDAEARNQRLFQIGGQGIAGPYTNLDNALLQGASKHPANRCS